MADALLSIDVIFLGVLQLFFYIALRYQEVTFYIALRYQEVTFICNYVCGYVVPSFLTNFGALYLTEFSTNFGQILDSNSYDQA